MEKSNFEPIYKKIDTNNNANKTQISTGNLNKTIQLSDMKKSSKKNNIQKDKNKKNIRLAFKNIEEEDIDKSDDIKTTTNKNRVNQFNSTFNLGKSNAHTITNNKGNHIKNKEINHKKNNIDKENHYNGRISTQNNDIAINLNKSQKVITKPQDSNQNKNRYQSLAKTERNAEKKKKLLDPSVYEGSQTEMTSGKTGNVKFLKNNKVPNNIKNDYYGPIDIKNIAIGNSPNEVIEAITDILHKNRVKFWKIGTLRLYCNKNGEIFFIEIFILSNKIIVKDDNDKDKDENEISEFDINSKHENDENNENKEENTINDNEKKINNKKKQMFYITILSKDSSNKGEANTINKLINKKFGKIFNK